MNTLSKAPAEKKENVLHRIEHKLKQSAKAMGTDANKYVKFIMEEFKSKANENINKQPVVSQRKSSRVVNEKPKVRSSVATDTKQEIIQEIADKIQSLAKGFMKNAKTIEKKKEVLQKIKKRIEESAKQKHMQIHSKHEELKEYSSLIAQGLEVSMRKMLDEEKAMNARRMQSDADNVPTIKNNITFEPVIENVDIEVKNRASHVIHDPHIDKTSKFLFDLTEINKYKQLIEESLNDTSIDPLCDEIVEETCLNIQSFNKISCGDGKTVPIEYLCNGEIDCRNHSDEENCTTQAIEKVRKATTVMADIEASFNRQCFASTSDGTILTAQNQILRDVLETQINFLQQHDQASPAETEKDKDHVDITFIKKTVGDVNMILSTLSYALDGTLCAQHIDPFRTGNSAARKYNDIEVDELDDGPEDPSWSPKSCTCKRQYCEDEKCAAAYVCRAHHLVVLRHNLQNVGLKHKGTVLGEVIETWRAKVSASLYIAEKPERPNHNAMTVIINRVLHDLVMAFAAMEDYRRTNSDYALKEFISISKIVMDTIKSCSN
ncbi:unnamed protein product [Chrysodeixis includens]|uniref:Uncharacterized protein n=1 Tax=Chrysodeixis includens TaxID=689277 RepID=A0A9N8Q175_CHRIL|nr:unnamed protein product [Chrysodeixis includens]